MVSITRSAFVMAGQTDVCATAWGQCNAPRSFGFPVHAEVAESERSNLILVTTRVWAIFSSTTFLGNPGLHRAIHDPGEH